MQMKTVRVMRPFFYERKPTKVGETIPLPALFAGEMVAARKAEWAPEPVAASVTAAEPSADSVTEKKEKGGAHARK